MTRLPLMEAGEFSAAKTGMVEALAPIPTPSNKRQANSCGHDWVNADPMTDAKQKKAETNIVPRRPMRWFNGCESQQPLHRDLGQWSNATSGHGLGLHKS